MYAGKINKIRIWQVCIIFATAIIIFSSCEKDDEKYELEFEITVPEDWQYWEYYFDDVTRFIAYSPTRLEDDADLVEDTLTESMHIYRLSMPGVDLDIFSAAMTAVWEETTNYQYIYASDTTVNGENAKKLIHLQTIRKPLDESPLDSVDLEILSMKVVFYRNDLGYIIECGMLPYTYDYYKPIFDGIISSFKFKEETL